MQRPWRHSREFDPNPRSPIWRSLAIEWLTCGCKFDPLGPWGVTGALQPRSLLFGPGVLQGAKPKPCFGVHAWIMSLVGTCGVGAEVDALQQPGSQSFPCDEVF